MNHTIPDYTIIEQLYESRNTLVYRARHEQSGRPVILKMLADKYPPPERIAGFMQEYEILNKIHFSGLPEVYDFVRNRRIIVMEDFGGVSLDRLKIGQMPLSDILPLFVGITDILGNIHRQHVIHKDINPSNIVLNPAAGDLRIIDFGISVTVSRENPTFHNPDVIEGTLAYISPEQTGRMNCHADYRTDFYSLGITFYELLTGQLPFITGDSLELIHCHIARQPMPPHKLRPEIPPMLSDIVMKLMAKNAEDRYQSAFGIKADLEQCLISETAGYFELGRYDVSNRFSISPKIYGRDEEILTLVGKFDLAAAGTKELLLITGQAGVGKSALVHEARKEITEKQGYFISGKFDQFQRNIPYVALTQAFDRFCDHLLTENDETLSEWRRKISEAVGNNGKVLTDVIPHLEKVIGKQPEVPRVGAQEAQNRFHLHFQFFIRAISQPDHPLVIFLDDLQWADFASLNLLKLLLSDPELSHLMIIGAYRDHEVGFGHPFLPILDDILKSGITVDRIRLENLNLAQVTELIRDSLACPTDAAESLSDPMYRKTLGNAFYLRQFLQSLYDDGLLIFEKGMPEWEIEAINARSITENVVEFMTKKIRKLPPETQEVLKIGSCIGNRFDVSVLSLIRRQSAEETLAQLRKSAEEGLIIASDAEFVFIHDRVQQSAYLLIEDADKPEIHLNIGRLLLSEMSDDGKLFEIVNHLNIGKSLITAAAETENLAQLNLSAGKKAKTSVAYVQASEYFSTGLGLLADDCWEAHYSLTLALHEEAAEAAYLCGRFDVSEHLTEIVMLHAKTVSEKSRGYEIRIQACIAQHRLPEALKAGLRILKILGIRLPEKPNKFHVLRSFAASRLILMRKRTDDLLDLPEMSDPHKLAVIRILMKLITVTIRTDTEMFALITLSIVKLSVRYGNTPESAFSYVCYGFMLSSIGNLESGYQFGRLALSLAERFNSKQFQGRVLFLFNNILCYWKENLNRTFPPFLKSYQLSMETGDFEYAAFSLVSYIFRYSIGNIGSRIMQELKTYDLVIRQMNQEMIYNYFRINAQLIANLAETTNDPCRLIGDFYDEEQMIPIHAQADDKGILWIISLHKMILSYQFYEYSRASENTAFMRKNKNIVQGNIAFPIFSFYDSLNNIAIFHETGKSEQKRILKNIAACQKRMKKWADHAPMNFLHKYYLVEAERNRIMGKDFQAMRCYDEAIRLAKEHDYISEEALAFELAGKFYLEKGLNRAGEDYLHKAHYTYRLWGAAAKVRAFEKRYPRIFEKSVSGTLSTDKALSQNLDTTAILKASQTLSGEIVLSRLLEKMMRVVIGIAGAERGVLMLPDQDRWLIEAETDVKHAEVRVLQSAPIESTEIPDAIIRYVMRTRRILVSDDAAKEGDFTHDPYILDCRPRSILCMPLMNQGKMTGILYLENHLTPRSFTPDKSELLSLLSSHLAISVENAKFYNTLERRVEERTYALAQEVRERKKAEEAAKSANQAKSDFLANISHDIRTPMNAILGFSEVLMTETQDHNHLKYINNILSAGQTLLALIDDLLDLSKVESGTLILESEPVNIRNIIEKIGTMFIPKADVKGIRIITEISPEIPEYLLMDDTRLTRILTNLIGNSIKFTHKGHVKVSVKCKMQSAKLNSDHFALYTLHFELKDTGIGIPEDQLELIFEMFRQQSGQSVKKYGGTGLGLAIARKLARLMNGDIFVESRVGEGSTFNVVFSDIREARIPVRAESCLPDDKRIAFEAAEILVVDDIPSNRELIRTYLADTALHITEAGDGETALNFLDSGLTPNIILMDMRLPGMNGNEAARIIRNKHGFGHVPLIALTASGMNSEIGTYSSLFDKYLIKPVGKYRLISVLKQFLPHYIRCETPTIVGHRQILNETRSDREISDWNKLFEQMEMNKDAFERFINLSIQDISDAISKLKSAVETEDCEAIFRCGHSIKGIAGNMEANLLKKTAFDIEISGKNTDTKQIRMLTDTIEREFDKLRDAIRGIIEKADYSDC